MLKSGEPITLESVRGTFATYGWETGNLLRRYQGNSAQGPQFLAIQFGGKDGRLVTGSVLVRQSKITGELQITLSSIDLMLNFEQGPVSVIAARNAPNVVFYKKPRQMISLKGRAPKVWYEFLTLEAWHQIMSDRFGIAFPSTRLRREMRNYSSLE